MSNRIANGQLVPAPPKKRRHSLILSDVEGQLPEEQTYQHALKQAIYGGVTSADAKQIVEGIVSRAKDGDKEAIKHFFDYVVGAKQNVKIVQNNYYEGTE